jgi:protein TonB
MEISSSMHLMLVNPITNLLNKLTMEAKKSPHADLESKRGMFFQVGLIVALGLSLVAFEWESPVKKIKVNGQWESVMEDVVIKNTFFKEQKPAPKPVVAPVIRLVDNNKSITDDLIINSEIKPDDIQPEYFIPVPVQLDDEKSVADETPFIIVEKMPEFPGGMNALLEFLVKNTRYPQTAAENGIQGTVYLYFVVEKDGSISSIKTLRGIGGGCNQEAERVLSLMPKWKPGNQFGKPVRVSYNVPVIFKLN